MNCLTHTKRMGAVSLLCSFLIGMAPGLITSGSGGIAGEITEIFGLSGSWDASSCYAQNGGMDNCLVGSLEKAAVREGTLGLCTYLSRATFYHIRYSVGTDEPEGSGDELTEVAGWNAVSGRWEKDGGTIRGNNRDAENCIFLSDVSIPANTPFRYEADVTVREGCAGALVFGYRNEGTWSAASPICRSG